MTRPLSLASLFGLFALLAGCRDSGPPLLAVSGTVVLDGAPLEDGQLTFRPIDPGLAPRAAVIRQGRYEVRLPAGRMIVEAHAAGPARTAETKDMGRGVEERVPDRYRGFDSVLRIEVTEAGENRFPLVLESAAPARPFR